MHLGESISLSELLCFRGNVCCYYIIKLFCLQTQTAIYMYYIFSRFYLDFICPNHFSKLIYRKPS